MFEDEPIWGSGQWWNNRGTEDQITLVCKQQGPFTESPIMDDLSTFCAKYRMRAPAHCKHIYAKFTLKQTKKNLFIWSQEIDTNKAE